MTVFDDATAVFTDDAGHRVEFRARPGAADWKRLCG